MVVPTCAGKLILSSRGVGPSLYSVEAAPVLNIWTIMSKVRLEAFMWGAGTALGESLPRLMKPSQLEIKIKTFDLQLKV
ncbi:hypothetical protein HAZT_HAZT002831 [Hyalella azteca]|uniref:Uncharacterized protein n=1 Tax=Hyalella azteca TaxID=294128 RepID=A0A6A0HEL8_HYAAZ|nr:hypothetical protein HAZT_HAZT002831 [Hyalella azteca]